MIYKSGTMSVSDTIKYLLRIPNQNTQISAITPFADSMWVSTADNKTMVIDDKYVAVYYTDPTLWDDEITEEDWENIVKMVSEIE